MGAWLGLPNLGGRNYDQVSARLAAMGAEAAPEVYTLVPPDSRPGPLLRSLEEWLRQNRLPPGGARGTGPPGCPRPPRRPGGSSSGGTPAGG